MKTTSKFESMKSHFQIIALMVGIVLHVVAVLVWNSWLRRRSVDPFSKATAWAVERKSPSLGRFLSKAFSEDRTQVQPVPVWTHVALLVVSGVGVLVFTTGEVLGMLSWWVFGPLLACLTYDIDKKRLLAFALVLSAAATACQKPTQSADGRVECVVDSAYAVTMVDDFGNQWVDTARYKRCFIGDVP